MTDPYGYSYSWSYLDNGWLKTQTLPASVTSTWTYNAWGNPVDLTTKTSTGGVLSEYGSVTYDGVGNTKSVIATVAGSSTYGGLTSYQYSTKDEVTQESSARNGGYTYAFGYDGAGNPTTFKGVTHGFNSSNQDTANTYDLEGNPTTYKGTSMTWDAEDRLTGIGSTWTAGYRGDSLRAWKNNAGTKTYFLYDGGTPVVELSSTGAVTAVNSFGAAGLLARKTSVGPSFYSFDLQGNVAQRLASTGAVQASFNFDAYGVGHVTTSTDPFGFGAQGGYYTDLETGLQAMSFRYYDAGAGRWLNRDPAGYGGGVNLYGYCGNGPVGNLDPSGLLVRGSLSTLDTPEGVEVLCLVEQQLMVNRGWSVLATLGIAACIADATSGSGPASSMMGLPGMGARPHQPPVEADAYFWDRYDDNIARALANEYYSGTGGGGSGGGEEWVRVGRWMNPAEYDKMVATGMVQPTLAGDDAKSVSFPPDPTSYRKVNPGDVFAEFDVPKSRLGPGGTGVWRTVFGPKSLMGRHRARQGQPVEGMPPALNITITATK